MTYTYIDDSMPYLGCIIHESRCVSFTTGIVKDINDTGEMILVSISSSPLELVRYSVTKTSLNVGELVFDGDLIGECRDSYRLQYFTKWRESSNLYYQTAQYTMYGQDPKDIIEGRYSVEFNPYVEYDCSNDSVELNGDTKKEFSGNRGDHIVEFSTNIIRK